MMVKKDKGKLYVSDEAINSLRQAFEHCLEENMELDKALSKKEMTKKYTKLIEKISEGAFLKLEETYEVTLNSKEKNHFLQKALKCCLQIIDGKKSEHKKEAAGKTVLDSTNMRLHLKRKDEAACTDQTGEMRISDEEKKLIKKAFEYWILEYKKSEPDTILSEEKQDLIILSFLDGMMGQVFNKIENDDGIFFYPEEKKEFYIEVRKICLNVLDVVARNNKPDYD